MLTARINAAEDAILIDDHHDYPIMQGNLGEEDSVGCGFLQFQVQERAIEGVVADD